MKIQQLLKKQIVRLEKKEKKLMDQQANQFVKIKLTPIMNKLEEKIPVKLMDTLDLAFYKGFQLVFEKGDKYIEKTYNKEKIQLEFDVNNYAVEKIVSRKTIVRLDKNSKISKRNNTYISFAEGTILGVLGIGLPDIPLFISVIMKTIYEVALSYGFDYKSDKEKHYILLLICVAMTKEDERKEFNKQLELFENTMDNTLYRKIDPQEQMKITAGVLSKALLTAKFIQGLPVVGVVGGVVNHYIVNKIGKYAALKYKKRYLTKKSIKTI